MSIQIQILSKNLFLKEHLKSLLPEFEFIEKNSNNNFVIVDLPFENTDLNNPKIVLVLSEQHNPHINRPQAQKPIRPQSLRKKILSLMNAETQAITLGPLVLNTEKKSVTNTQTDQRTLLTEKECALLQHLIFQKNTSKEYLLKKVWGYNEEIETNTLETHIYRLRQKLKAISDGQDMITNTTEGYKV